MLLIVPLPYTWKRKLFTFISENPLIAKLQYGMKVGLYRYTVTSPLLTGSRYVSYSF